MGALTVRLPDDKHQRLKALAKTRGAPLNRLIDEMTTLMLAEFDAETRFRLHAQQGTGQTERGLANVHQRHTARLSAPGRAGVANRITQWLHHAIL